MPTFHVTLPQAGPEFDPALPFERQTDLKEHAAYMDSLVEDGHLVLGGPLPNGRVGHAMDAASEEELHDLGTRPVVPIAPDPRERRAMEIRLDGRGSS